MSTADQSPWDVFISYASEDRQAVAKPLAQLLQDLGLRVWYDETELKVGDSLRERIDDGLARCRYGVVILSQAFFGKHYPTRELNGLAQREVDGHNVILPVWHAVDAATIRRFSLPLADKVAVAWDAPDAVMRLLDVIRPELASELRRAGSQLKPLPIVDSGKDLARIVSGPEMNQFFNDPAPTEGESELIAAFLQQMQDWGDIWDDLEAGAKVRAEFSLQKALDEVSTAGWMIYGDRIRRTVRVNGEGSEWSVAVIAALKGKADVFLNGDSIAVLRREESP